MKKKFPVWQFILPVSVSGVLIFAIGAITVVYLNHGSLVFNFKITPSGGLEIVTTVEKK